MASFKDTNSFIVYGWMGNQLGLKGTERIVYAIVYSFSQDGESDFYGGHRYMADAAAASVDTVKRALDNLIKKGLIGKAERENDGVSHCRYYAFIDDDGVGIFKDGAKCVQEGAKCQQGEGAKCTGGRVQNAPTYNNKENNIINKEINKEKINKKDAEASPMSEDEQYFYKFLKERCPYVYKMEQPMTYEQYKKACSKYSREKIWKALDAMNNWKELNKKRRYAYKTLLNWLERDNQQYK